MSHESHWREVKRRAEERICSLFENCKLDIEEIIGHGMDEEFSPHDAKKVLKHVLKHGDCDEQACAILALGDLMHAQNELHEHEPETH